jgi:hypothetical protein
MAGAVRVQRRCYRCRVCGAARTPWDEWAGLGKGHLSVGARRLACLAASAWSFDEASRSLSELCGIEVSDETVRRVSGAEGANARRWLDSPRASEPVGHAAGQDEWLADGTMVNTRAGWREMRVLVRSKRHPGEPMDPTAWSELGGRDLPRPEATLITARFADCEQVGEDLERAARVWGVAAA